MGGSGGGEPAVNGCTASAAEDHTADMSVTITTMGLAYTPKCVRIMAGSSATFNADFGVHPLSGGDISGGVASPDPTSPIAVTTMGTTATFTFPNAGTFPYYCSLHGLSTGMAGAIFVE
jgi:plastocyanin